MVECVDVLLCVVEELLDGLLDVLWLDVGGLYLLIGDFDVSLLMCELVV